MYKWCRPLLSSSYIESILDFGVVCSLSFHICKTSLLNSYWSNIISVTKLSIAGGNTSNLNVYTLCNLLFIHTHTHTQIDSSRLCSNKSFHCTCITYITHMICMYMGIPHPRSKSAEESTVTQPNFNKHTQTQQKKNNLYTKKSSHQT